MSTSELVTTEEATQQPKTWLTSPNGTQYQTEQSPLTQVEIEELLAQLDAEARKRRQKRRLSRVIAGVYVALLLVAVVHRIAAGKWGDFPFGLTNVVWIFTLGAATQFQKDGVRKLATTGDLRAVGHFAEALEFGDKDVADEAASALVTLLPQMKASDAHLMDDAQRGILYRALRGDRTKLILAILKALEQIGDEKAVAFVEEIVNGKVGRLRPEVRWAAGECLPALKERVERERAAHTLLRAAQAEGADSDVLLRPAASGSEPSADLLRPAGEEADVHGAA